MVCKEFREWLDDYCQDKSEDELPIVFENHAYDNSIIGITEDNRLVYDYELMISEYMKDEECSYDEAQEWVDYNTIRALPYIKGNSPIIIYPIYVKNNLV